MNFIGFIQTNETHWQERQGDTVRFNNMTTEDQIKRVAQVSGDQKV